MNSKQFQRYLDRDEGCCHCGTTEGLAPHHRANRGMGGSKARDVPSNIIVICSLYNGLLESNYTQAQLGIAMGWKLTAGQDPKLTPVNILGRWFLLDDDFGKVEIKALQEPE